MPAKERLVFVPKVEDCEEIPATEIERGNRLITVPERDSKMGTHVIVQDVEIQRIDGRPINVTVLARAQAGIEVRMQLEPGTLVRRF
jgi:hypothetical protein